MGFSSFFAFVNRSLIVHYLKISRGKFPRLIFSCPVPSGLPHGSHCVPINMNRCGFRTFVAAGEGFEPSHTESESAVLPLHKPAIFVRSCRTNRYYYTGKQEFVKGFLKKIIFADFSHFQGVFYGKYVLRVYHQKRISSFHK